MFSGKRLLTHKRREQHEKRENNRIDYSIGTIFSACSQSDNHTTSNHQKDSHQGQLH